MLAVEYMIIRFRSRCRCMDLLSKAEVNPPANHGNSIPRTSECYLDWGLSNISAKNYKLIKLRSVGNH